MCPKDADRMANSVDPDQTDVLSGSVLLDPNLTAPLLGAVRSGSALFAQTYLFENVGKLQ